jgi:ribokinase
MSTSKSIIVVGSSNTDMVIQTNKFPVPGETLLGGKFFLFPGGKGANQAVAAARLGGLVTFIAKVGNDIFGEQALQQFKKEGIRTDFIISDPSNPSGVALITVDAKGENTIVVAQGATEHLPPKTFKKPIMSLRIQALY